VSDRLSTVLGMYKCSSEKQVQRENTAAVGWMAIEEGAWAVCVCISYTGDGGQLGCSFLWSGRGVGVGRATAKTVIGQMINEVVDRCDV
jgi:hypothetical protein